MLAPQPVVAALLFAWGAPVAAGVVVLLIGAQLLLMRRLLTDPRKLAPWYNATGTSLYVLGMLAAAIAVGGMS
jgi:chlorophyll synthase